MTKTVMTNDMVQHVWAHQTQDYARTANGNMHFDGPLLYSYATPIANIVEGVALITTETYSVTTSGKHMPGWRELDGVRSWFTVPHIAPRIWQGRYHAQFGTWEECHAANLAHYVAQYANLKAKFMRRLPPEWCNWTQELNGIAKEATRYANVFGLASPALELEINLDVALILEADRKRNTPEMLAKRQKDAAKRAERKLVRERAAAIAAYERDRAGLAGENSGFRGRMANGGALLRVKGDTLETSQGASVPLDHAIKVFRFVKLCRDKGTAWERNGHTMRVGHFQVDRIAANGDFHAGCHFITWAECERLAKLLGVFEAAPSAEGLELSSHAA